MKIKGEAIFDVGTITEKKMKTGKNNKEDAVAMETYPMKGGDGIYSYTKNSSWQRDALEATKAMIAEAITEYLDINQLSATFCIADLGCSVGPNTFIAVENVVEAVKSKYITRGLESRVPEFHVFFNDHISNDFNTLFASLPPERQYSVAASPGSFYGRLFPESSLHFVHSSSAIQWLSKVPEELVDTSSVAFNKGRVHYYGAPEEVGAAYAAQRAKDMEQFLDARAKELVSGGMLVFTLASKPDHLPHSSVPMGFLFDLIGSCLMDMAKQGLISETKVDTFNIPVYATSVEEIKEAVTRNGCFGIDRLELSKPMSNVVFTCLGNEEACAMHVRAGLEGMVNKHFGSEIIDQLFDHFAKKVGEFSDQLDSSFKQGTQMLVVLKRH